MKVQAGRQWKMPFLVCAVMLMASTGLKALPVTCLSLLSNGQDTYQNLMNLGSSGCTIEDKLFTGFDRGTGTLAGSGYLPSATNTTFSIIDGGPTGPIGFQFNFVTNAQPNGMSAIANAKATSSTVDFSMSFNVQIFGSSMFLTGAQACFSGTSTSTTPCATPPPTAGASSTPGFLSSALIAETLVDTGNGSSTSLTLVNEGPISQNSDSTALPGLPAGDVLSVSKDINVSANYPTGGPNQMAFIKSFAETFTESATRPTPEPGFYGLLAAGLGGIFVAVKRRRKSV